MTTDDKITRPTFVAKLFEEERTGFAQVDRVRVGQSLAEIELDEIIGKTKRWARAGQLNRGLSLTLPYFDDQVMEIRWRELQVIPRGRVPFVPAFVVIAARLESEKANREDGLSATTREHLLGQLRRLDLAFGGGAHDLGGLGCTKE
jgi:hypothetical protein